MNHTSFVVQNAKFVEALLINNYFELYTAVFTVIEKSLCKNKSNDVI